MTLLAPTLEAFFTQHLAGQRQASPRTIGSYRDTWRLFLGYALEQTGPLPPRLDIAALDAGLVSGFLAHLEQDRGNTRPDPQRPAGRDPVVLQVRRAAPPRARRAHRPGPRDPRQEARPAFRLLPHRRRDRGPARRPGHRDLARPPRPRAPRPRRPDRAADHRAHRPDPRRRPDRDRADRPLPRQGTQGPHHPAHRERRRRDPQLAPRTARQPARSAVPDPHRPAPVLRRRRSSSSPGTPPRPRRAARPCRTRTSPRTPFVILRPWPCCMPGSTPSPSPSGSVTKARDRHSRYIHADLKLKEKALARTASPKTKTGRYRPPDKLLAFLEGLRLCRPPDTREHGRQDIPGDRRHNRGLGIRSVRPISA